MKFLVRFIVGLAWVFLVLFVICALKSLEFLLELWLGPPWGSLVVVGIVAVGFALYIAWEQGNIDKKTPPRAS